MNSTNGDGLVHPATSPTTSTENPRKRGRTACTRCKNRKQKCDDQWPICSNCRKSGADCDKTAITEDEPLPAGYTRALEERVAFLEIKLAQLGQQPVETQQIPEANPVVQNHNALGEVVEFLSLGHFEAPAYVGSSSGLSLAVNLGEMVQATVWNKALPGSHDSPPKSGAESISSPDDRSHVSRYRAITMEDLHANSAEPPSDESGLRILNAYFMQLHPRYPFLDRDELLRLHSDRLRLRATASSDLSRTERFGIFKLYLVYAIGAMLIQLTKKRIYSSPESFYMTALQHISAARDSRTIQNIEAMTLLIIYHLRSASSHGMWYMTGLAMRTCVDLGLHRKDYESNLDPYTIQMRRRLFWTVYSLERVISISLGRPFSISDRHIDVELPTENDDDDDDLGDRSSVMSSPIASPKKSPLAQAVILFKLRRIESKIQHSIYRADRKLASLRPKMDRLYMDLENWKAGLVERFSGSELNYPMLHYHRAVRLLIQPFLSMLPITDPYYHICIRSAGEICQAHKRLHQTLDYGHSFIAVQTVFVAGITMLYSLWTSSHKVWSVAMSNDIRACSLVLFVMGERASWVKKYRDAFEMLVNATMEKLQGGPSLQEGMAETAAAHINANASADDHGRGHDDAMRMVLELANWIDHDENTPAWMPNFEVLQNLSNNL